MMFDVEAGIMNENNNKQLAAKKNFFIIFFNEGTDCKRNHFGKIL